MRRLFAMFPGQGSQYVGMGKALAQEFPLARETFEQAEDAIKISLRHLCFEGPEEDLKLTANTQPAILTASVALWRVLNAETGIKPSLCAGHSLGEYSALVASGRLGFSQAVYLVRRRGEAMQEAVPPGVGAMAAVLNCPVETLRELCATHSHSGTVVEIANYNSAQQLVVAGHKKAVDALVQALQALKIKAVELPVSAPFHSRLMEPARQKMASLIDDTPFSAGTFPIIPNLTAEICADYDRNDLIRQIDGAVLWMQSMHKAAEDGTETYLEIGPGRVLTGLAKRILPADAGFFLNTEEPVALIKQLNDPKACLI